MPYTSDEHDTLISLVGSLGENLSSLGLMLCTAESCTGGLIATLCTDIPGSSAWFMGGVVAYANSVKSSVLGVSEDTLKEHGAVSGPVVQAMVKGAMDILGADVGIAVSGVAGPGGGTKDKPVGTVWIAVAMKQNKELVSVVKPFFFSGSRSDIRIATAKESFAMVAHLIAPPF